MATRRAGYGTVTTRETPLDEKRANARERVAGAARSGHVLRDMFSADDLTWAFRGYEDDLARLEREAEEAGEEKAARRRNNRRNEEVRGLADKIEAEWDAAAKTERRSKAVAEARRRLGLDGGGDE